MLLKRCCVHFVFRKTLKTLSPYYWVLWDEIVSDTKTKLGSLFTSKHTSGRGCLLLRVNQPAGRKPLTSVSLIVNECSVWMHRCCYNNGSLYTSIIQTLSLRAITTHSGRVYYLLILSCTSSYTLRRQNTCCKVRFLTGLCSCCKKP